MTEPEVLMRLRGGGPRTILSVGALAVLAGLLLSLTVTQQMTPGWRIMVGVFGFVSLWGAWTMHKATGIDLVLTRAGLFDATGRELAAMDDIVAVKRGIFEVKPSSGFLIKLSRRYEFGWAPGVWWRFGRRLGIGGAVSGNQAKALAEMLELVVADRAGLLKRD